MRTWAHHPILLSFSCIISLRRRDNGVSMPAATSSASNAFSALIASRALLFLSLCRSFFRCSWCRFWASCWGWNNIGCTGIRGWRERIGRRGIRGCLGDTKQCFLKKTFFIFLFKNSHLIFELSKIMYLLQLKLLLLLRQQLPHLRQHVRD